MFAANGYDHLATSNVIDVAAPSVAASLSGGTITATVANGPASRTDRVGLFAVGAPNGSFLAWNYLSNTHVPPASGLAAATVAFTGPSVAGVYEVRFFASDGFTRLAASNPLTVN